VSIFPSLLSPVYSFPIIIRLSVSNEHVLCFVERDINCLVNIYKIQSLYRPCTFAVAILFKRNALCSVLFNANFSTSVHGTENICSFTFSRDLIFITFGMAHLTRDLTVVTILQLVTFLSDELCLPQAPSLTRYISAIQPIPVAARSKAWVCGRSLDGIALSNFVGRITSVCCECCASSGRGLCDGLVTCPEEPYRVWCV